MIGIFEYEQAAALHAAGVKTVYAFCDNRSVKVNRTVKPICKTVSGMQIYGRRLPVKGLPKPLFDACKTAEFRKLLKTIVEKYGKPDVVHVHFPLLTLTHGILQELSALDAKLVITEHWTKVQTKGISEKQVRLLSEIVEAADAFICVSQKLRDSVQELTQTKKQLYVVPNVVGKEFHYIPKKAQEGGKYVFSAIGRLVPVKRFNVAIAAFAKEFKNDSNVILKVVGGGKEYGALEKQIQSLNMQNRIELTGYKAREEVFKILAETDCYVSASVLETFGVPFIEAWVTGIPCIGAKNGPIDSYFTEETGLLFPPDDVDALAAVMRQMYQNSSRYDGKKISEWAASQFTGKSVAARLCEIYDY